MLIGLIELKGTVLAQKLFSQESAIDFQTFSIKRLPLKAVNNKTKIEKETRKINKRNWNTSQATLNYINFSQHCADLHSNTLLNLFFVSALCIPRGAESGCSETCCVQVGTALILTRAVHLISTSSIAAGFIALIFTAVLCSWFPRNAFHAAPNLDAQKRAASRSVPRSS